MLTPLPSERLTNLLLLRRLGAIESSLSSLHDKIEVLSMANEAILAALSELKTDVATHAANLAEANDEITLKLAELETTVGDNPAVLAKIAEVRDSFAPALALGVSLANVANKPVPEAPVVEEPVAIDPNTGEPIA